jgi:hypothetical protein
MDPQAAEAINNTGIACLRQKLEVNLMLSTQVI